MGDPKKLRKKYNTPACPWNEQAIEEQKILKKEYGLRQRREILIASSFLKKYKDIAKKLIANKTLQGEKEKQQVILKLQRLGLLPIGTCKLDDILSLQLKDILERRIQSLTFRKGLARSMKQARQFITHGHVSLGEKVIDSPAHLVEMEKESQITFKKGSSLSQEAHPERLISQQAKEIKKEAEAIRTFTKESTKEKTEEQKSEEQP